MRLNPGQVAFPGGREDPEDGGDPVACALRETREELGLDSKYLIKDDSLQLSSHIHFRGIHVLPVVFRLHPDVVKRLPGSQTAFTEASEFIKVGPDEVDFAFYAPVSKFNCPGLEQFFWYNYHTTMVGLTGRDDIRVWGFTAMFLLELVDHVR